MSFIAWWSWGPLLEKGKEKKKKFWRRRHNVFSYWAGMTSDINVLFLCHLYGAVRVQPHCNAGGSAFHTGKSIFATVRLISLGSNWPMPTNCSKVFSHAFSWKNFGETNTHTHKRNLAGDWWTIKLFHRGFYFSASWVTGNSGLCTDFFFFPPIQPLTAWHLIMVRLLWHE